MKKNIKRIAVACMITTLLAGSCNISASVENIGDNKEKEYVVVTETNIESTLSNAVRINDISSEELNTDDVYAVKIDATKDELKKVIKKNMFVSENITLNATSKEDWANKTFAKIGENDAEWNMKMINCENEITKAKTKVKIAILDSGIDLTSEIDVKERINFVEEEQDIFTLFEDTSGHGTSIAGIIAAKDNGIGITGINPNAEIYSARILDDNNQATLSRVIEGIYWAIEKGVHIISISFGTDQNVEVLHKAIQDAEQAGILIIASAGNNGGKIEYPAAYPEVMAVGSVDLEGTLSETSSRGRQLEIVAPGEYVKTTGSFGGELITSGTSISVPHVVGVASVLWEKDLNCSNNFIRELLSVSANRSDNPTISSSGIVDMEYALSIYDTFKKNYSESKDMDSIIEENSAELNTENINVVNARWTKDGHVSLADKAGKIHDLTATQIAILKMGIKYPDEKFPGMIDNPQWHTAQIANIDNYISNYRCATLIARAIKKGKSIDTITKPNGMISSNFKKMKKQINDIAWSSALQGKTVNKANKALFTLGMAMHIITDTYAHQSYVKKNGEWKYLTHSGDDCDNSSVYKKRFVIAGEAACDALQCYLVGDTGDHWEYVQEYDGTSFRLKRLVRYAKEQDTYSSNTFGDMDKLKKGDVAYD